MGRCHEFGVQIREGCDHPMVAGKAACGCEACWVSCSGRFEGCPSVWANGSVEVTASASVAWDSDVNDNQAAVARTASAESDAAGRADVGPALGSEQEAVLRAVSAKLAGVEAIAGELRNELVRLVAFREALAGDLPAVARAVDEASARAEARLVDLTDRVEELAGGRDLTLDVRGATTPAWVDA